MSSWKTALGKATRVIAANIVGCVLILLMIEGGVRALHPEITPVGTDKSLFADSVFGAVPGPRPHAAGTSNGARFRADAHGFWQYTRAPSHPQASWLFLGDSVTMGIGVAPDSTFAGRLAAALDSVAVLNPSLIGYAAPDYHAILRTLVTLPDRAPAPIQRVTVFWCLNDVYAADDLPSEGGPGTQVRQLGGRLLTFIRQHVRTYQWLKTLFFDRPASYYAHDRCFYAEPSALLDSAVPHLKAMQGLSAAQGLPLDVVLLPYAHQLRDKAPNRLQPQAVLQQRLHEAGLSVHNPAAFLAQHAPNSALYLHGDGIHFSERGHALLADFIQRRLLTASATPQESVVFPLR